MTHLYQIDGMSCKSCIAKVKSELLKLGEITEAEIQLAYPQAKLTMSSHISVSTLQNAITRAGDYRITETGGMPVHETIGGQSNNWLKTYKPLLLVFAFIIMVGTLASFRDGKFHTMHLMPVGLALQNPQKIEASLDRIERESQRLDELVGELLTLSRLEAGTGTLRREHFDLVELVASVADDARFEAQATGRDIAFAAGERNRHRRQCRAAPSGPRECRPQRGQVLGGGF